MVNTESHRVGGSQKFIACGEGSTLVGGLVSLHLRLGENLFFSGYVQRYTLFLSTLSSQNNIIWFTMRHFDCSCYEHHAQNVKQ